MKKELFKNIDPKWKAYALAACIAIICYLILINISSILGGIGKILSVFKSVFLGAIIAYIMNPLAKFFQNKVFKRLKNEKAKWVLGVIVTIIIVFALFGLLVASMIPQLAESVSYLIKNAQSYINNLKELLQNTVHTQAFNNIIDSLVGDNGVLSKIAEYLKENLDKIIATTSNIGKGIVNWLIGAIFAIYFLMAKEGIRARFNQLFELLLTPLKLYQSRMILDKFNGIFSKYIICQLIDSLIIGTANYLFMAIMQMPNALFISVIAGLTNLIPTFGPVIGAAFGGFILLLMSPSSVLPYLIFTVFIQLMDSYVIKPKLFGDALDVPGFLILVSIIVFGNLMGITGMLLAIPIAAILVYLYTEAFIPWLELRRDLKEFHQKDS